MLNTREYPNLLWPNVRPSSTSKKGALRLLMLFVTTAMETFLLSPISRGGTAPMSPSTGWIILESGVTIKGVTAKMSLSLSISGHTLEGRRPCTPGIGCYADPLGRTKFRMKNIFILSDLCWMCFSMDLWPITFLLSNPAKQLNNLTNFVEYEEKVEFLPVVKGLNILQGEQNCFVGSLLPVLTKIKANLSSEKEKVHVCKALDEALGIDQRLKKIESDFFYITGALHPHLKTSWIESAEKRASIWNLLDAELKEIGDASPAWPGTQESAIKSTDDLESFFPVIEILLTPRKTSWKHSRIKHSAKALSTLNSFQLWRYCLKNIIQHCLRLPLWKGCFRWEESCLGEKGMLWVTRCLKRGSCWKLTLEYELKYICMYDQYMCPVLTFFVPGWTGSDWTGERLSVSIAWAD